MSSTKQKQSRGQSDGEVPSTKRGSKTEVHPLVTEHAAKILAWEQADREVQAAIEAQDKTARLSAGATKANRKHEIRQLELDMRTESIEFAKWEEPVRPKKSRSRAKAPTLSQEQLTANLAKVHAVLVSEATDEEMKHTADMRINDLLRQAQRAGYTVADPRKAKSGS